MKRFVFAFVFLMTVLVGTVGHASDLANNQFAIGGISPSCTMDYVESVYGTPSNQYTKYTDGQYITTYNYGDALLVYGIRGYVISVACSESNLSTPDGVTVGMPASVLTTTYGKARKVFQHDGATVYEYGNQGVLQLLFFVKNFYITKITCAADF